MIYRDIHFEPYPEDLGGGWQAKIETRFGLVSVRYGSEMLLTTDEKPFEVRYNGDVWACQDEKDIYYFIQTGEIPDETKALDRIAHERLEDLSEKLFAKPNMPYERKKYRDE